MGNLERSHLAEWFCSNRFKVKVMKEFLMLFDFEKNTLDEGDICIIQLFQGKIFILRLIF